ncbi:phage antirepressor N-terminal domain-containing protein [Streptomyces brevispora]|uniref:phage antirepressor N-terminal domain-containing protein n=1 Tax=Streptomyces brevispora TaxID=887462 RepID=UPI002E2F1FEE|nr:phage antirepressor N-terminal domain-containing protein [Streptomyces brevispora]
MKTLIDAPDPDEPNEHGGPAEVARIKLSTGAIDTVLVDGEPFVVFRPAVEAIGLSYPAQFRKLRDRSWVNRSDIATVAEDGKTRLMAAVDVRTFLMWLATVNENKVAEAVRSTLVAYQRETTTAVNDYWTRGGAINERATDDQLDALQQQIEERRMRRALGLITLVAAMDDSVDPRWKRTRQLHHYAEASGEVAEIAPGDRALLVETYLNDQGLSRTERKSVRSSFGRRVSLAYQMTHDGRKPKDSFGLVDGRERAVKSYTEADRPLFDKVWEEFYADRYPGQPRLDGGAS